MIGLTVLGATGSVGLSTLDVAARHPDRFRVIALTANTAVDRLVDLCVRHRPDYAAIAEAGCAADLAAKLSDRGLSTEVLAGAGGLSAVAQTPDTDCVMAAIVGAAGLAATLAAVRAGKRVLLANKESLVMSGPLFMEEVRRSGAQLLPIDSEHNALFQCMPPGYVAGAEPPGVERILLTASGGPFRTTPLEALDGVTPEQAVDHPRWVMGRKISVDSATMMNKGLEVIEASWLFNTPAERIEVVVHPQSVIHSLVRYVDGSVLAHLGNPDMRTPIAHALGWPQRIAAGVEPLDLIGTQRLDFESPDPKRFPCLPLAFEALRAGGNASVVLNAANEVAVAAFLAGRIGFTAIPALIRTTLEMVPQRPIDAFETLLDEDRRARELAEGLLVKFMRGA